MTPTIHNQINHIQILISEVNLNCHTSKYVKLDMDVDTKILSIFNTLQEHPDLCSHPRVKKIISTLPNDYKNKTLDKIRIYFKEYLKKQSLAEISVQELVEIPLDDLDEFQSKKRSRTDEVNYKSVTIFKKEDIKYIRKKVWKTFPEHLTTIYSFIANSLKIYPEKHKSIYLNLFKEIKQTVKHFDPALQEQYRYSLIQVFKELTSSSQNDHVLMLWENVVNHKTIKEFSRQCKKIFYLQQEIGSEKFPFSALPFNFFELEVNSLGGQFFIKWMKNYSPQPILKTNCDPLVNKTLTAILQLEKIDAISVFENELSLIISKSPSQEATIFLVSVCTHVEAFGKMHFRKIFDALLLKSNNYLDDLHRVFILSKEIKFEFKAMKYLSINHEDFMIFFENYFYQRDRKSIVEAKYYLKNKNDLYPNLLENCIEKLLFVGDKVTYQQIVTFYSLVEFLPEKDREKNSLTIFEIALCYKSENIGNLKDCIIKIFSEDTMTIFSFMANLLKLNPKDHELLNDLFKTIKEMLLNKECTNIEIQLWLLPVIKELANKKTSIDFVRFANTAIANPKFFITQCKRIYRLQSQFKIELPIRKIIPRSFFEIDNLIAQEILTTWLKKHLATHSLKKYDKFFSQMCAAISKLDSCNAIKHFKNELLIAIDLCSSLNAVLFFENLFSMINAYGLEELNNFLNSNFVMRSGLDKQFYFEKLNKILFLLKQVDANINEVQQFTYTSEEKWNIFNSYYKQENE